MERFVLDPESIGHMELMERHPNVVVFRTFSKMYALAGLRVGYVCGQKDVIEYVRRTHIVYSVNTLGQPAATAALSDDAEHIAATRRMVAEAKALLLPAFDALGLTHVEGAGNFVMAPKNALGAARLSGRHRTTRSPGATPRARSRLAKRAASAASAPQVRVSSPQRKAALPGCRSTLRASNRAAMFSCSAMLLLD